MQKLRFSHGPIHWLRELVDSNGIYAANEIVKAVNDAETKQTMDTDAGMTMGVLLGKPTIDAFEVYNDFDRNLVNLFRCMKDRTMATIRELGVCHLNSREDFLVLRKFFEQEQFDDRYLTEELALTEILLPPPEAAELKEIRLRITEAGIEADAPLQFTAADGKVTMENVPPNEADIVCDGDCERCPLHLLADLGKYSDGL